MAYCRWSCDRGRSDVYVYEGQTGWITHVAFRRLVHPEGKGPPTPPMEAMVNAYHTATPDELTEIYDAAKGPYDAWRAECAVAPISHPEAGEYFTHDGPGACADNLERLAAEGFHVPEWVVPELRAEQGEQE